MLKLLFSFKGRIGRKQYWRVLGLAILSYFVGGETYDSYPPVGLGLMIAGIWSFLAIHAKRCHDHGKSGSWSLMPLWNVIALGCLRGTTGHNGYGEDPLAALSSSQLSSAPNQQQLKPRPPPAPKPKKQTPSPSQSVPRKPQKPRGISAKEKAPKKASGKPSRKDTAPPATVVPTDPNASIQKMVKTAGDSLEIFPPCEFAGPLTIDRSITVDFGNSTLWAIKGPVLTVRGSKVCIRNAHIEVTGSMDGANEDENTAIHVKGRGKATFENVKVHGRIKGIKGEDGQWKIPRSLSLGTLAAGQSHEFRVHLEVPAECELQAEGPAGLTLYPQRLAVGDQEVILQFAEHFTGHYSAHIMLATRNFKRRIALNACFCDLDLNPAAIKGEGQLIYPVPVAPKVEAPRDAPAIAPTPVEPTPPISEEKGKAPEPRPPIREPSPAVRPETPPTVVSPPPRRPRIVSQPGIPLWAGGSQGSALVSDPDSQPVVPVPPEEKDSQDKPEKAAAPIAAGSNAQGRDSKRISAKPGKAFDI